MVNFLKTKADFDQALKDAGDKLVVIDFTASWCGPCQRIAPKYVEMAKEFPDVIFYKVDVDENDETAEAEKIQAMPTFKFYKSGKALSDYVQGANEAGLREKIKKNK
uniref:Thioredoxin n=1 Tax=Geodia cydonium TaxID=6047 RepID=THIO_GEOCY|nr:RecName: Full=Thioredoxin; Short=Trx [Geodia cydonium]CAA76654.1 thioredoxin [Geodia cydonium]